MKKTRFYVCPSCANVLCCSGEADLSCCGRRLQPLTPQNVDHFHQVSLQEIDDDYFLSIKHEMTKQHYISFVACVAYDRILLVKLYPEQAPEIRLPRISHAEFYIYCNKHGLMRIEKK